MDTVVHVAFMHELRSSDELTLEDLVYVGPIVLDVLLIRMVVGLLVVGGMVFICNDLQVLQA